MTKNPADTHPWPFPDADATSLTLTTDHIATLRSLVAVWDIAETGAPGLVLPDGEELEDHPLAPYVDLFLNAAKLQKSKGQITNALLADAMPPEDREYLLEYIPDKNLRAQVSRDMSIPFTATTQDHALWNAAQLGATGIDPKRPFGTGNVARDMRAVLDPENKLSRGEFTKLKRHAFSRMILMLQFFVQQATLTPGTYWRTPKQGWQHADQMRNAPEQIDEAEWVSRMQTSFFRAEFRYCSDLRYYVFENQDPVNLKGSYAEVAQRLELVEIYTNEHYGIGPSYLLEKALSFLRHWPETTGEPNDSFASLVAARCCNAVGDFKQAAAVIADANLKQPEPEFDLKLPVSADEALWANMIVTARGLGQISDQSFVAMFDQPLQGGGTWGDRVTQIYKGKEPKGWECYDAAYHQIKLMRAMLVVKA